MFSFLRKNQIPLTCGVCLFLSLYIMNAAARGQLKHDPVGPALLWVMRPLQVGAEAASDSIRKLEDTYTSVVGFNSENQRLKKRIQELEIERNKLLEAAAVNQRLQELLELKTRLASKTVTASIIGKTASTWFQTCLLDKGTADGVQKGMAVVTPMGILGQVVSATGHTAKVLLMTDPNSGVDSLVQRTRARGIVSGSLENGPVMKYVKRSEEVREGDPLITSGADGIFPKGLPVGTVSKVRKQNLGLFQYVEVAPAVLLSRTEEVLIVAVNPAEVAADNSDVSE
jgi:rod shape-determining protein MreC